MSTATDERAPVPSKVLIHYLKDNAPIAPEVSPPVVLKGVASGSSLPPGAYPPDCDSGVLCAEFESNMDSMAAGADLDLDGAASTLSVLGVPLGDALLAPPVDCSPDGSSFSASRGTQPPSPLFDDGSTLFDEALARINQ